MLLITTVDQIVDGKMEPDGRDKKVKSRKGRKKRVRSTS